MNNSTDSGGRATQERLLKGLRREEFEDFILILTTRAFPAGGILRFAANALHRHGFICFPD
jgi:hypothetical protein